MLQDKYSFFERRYFFEFINEIRITFTIGISVSKRGEYQNLRIKAIVQLAIIKR